MREMFAICRTQATKGWELISGWAIRRRYFNDFNRQKRDREFHKLLTVLLLLKCCLEQDIASQTGFTTDSVWIPKTVNDILYRTHDAAFILEHNCRSIWVTYYITPNGAKRLLLSSAAARVRSSLLRALDGRIITVDQNTWGMKKVIWDELKNVGRKTNQYIVIVIIIIMDVNFKRCDFYTSTFKLKNV